MTLKFWTFLVFIALTSFACGGPLAPPSGHYADTPGNFEERHDGTNTDQEIVSVFTQIGGATNVLKSQDYEMVLSMGQQSLELAESQSSNFDLNNGFSISAVY